MRFIEHQLRRAIRKTIISELEGKEANEWEAAYRKADEILAHDRDQKSTAEMSRGEAILDRIERGLDTLVGPELKMLDRFLKSLGI